MLGIHRVIDRSMMSMALFLLITATSITWAVQTKKDERDIKRTSPDKALEKKRSDPYCGLYCLYTVLKINGHQGEFVDLIKSDYLGSIKGSSLLELKRAAEDRGMYAAAIGDMDIMSLHYCTYPLILHTKASLHEKDYNHYILYLGQRDGQALIFDPPTPVKLLDFHELSPKWDGNGLVVSSQPVDIGSIFAPARKRFTIFVAITLVIVLIVHRVKRWLPEIFLPSRGKLLGLSTGQTAGFAITALLCGILYHFANDEGLLANANATELIQRAHVANFIPKIDERKVHKLLDSDTVFIDARLARDYKAGHLDGAISVPVDANDLELQKVTAKISKDSRIVIYCQSARCKYAEKVATKLQNNGYSNISIFKGGWAEWVEMNGNNKKDETS